jgi:hypothetical protein
MKIIGLTMVLVLLAPMANAESPLEAAAKKERERREKNKDQGVQPVRVITQDDIKTNDSDRGSWSDKSGESGAASTKPSSSSSKGAQNNDQSSADNEKMWRDLARQARARIDAARKRLESTPKYKPGKTTEYIGSSGRVVGRETEAELNFDYLDAQHELEGAEQGLKDLEEKARRAGALPGWLR